MKKEFLFVFALLISVSCGTVETRQSLPIVSANAPRGCYYIDRGGNGNSGGYVAVKSNWVADPGLVFIQIAQGNAMMTLACSRASLEGSYGMAYEAYIKDQLSHGDEEIKVTVVKTAAKVDQLNDSILELAELTAATPTKTPAPDKKGKKGKQIIASAPAEAPVPTYSAPASTAAPAPVYAPAPVAAPAPTQAPIDPSIAGRLETAQNKSACAQVLTEAARNDPTNAATFLNLAKAVGEDTDANFARNRADLVRMFKGGAR
jgi:hypothetical protein